MFTAAYLLIELKNESGVVLAKDLDIASCFNTFFSSVFTQDNHEVLRSIDMRSSEDCADIQFSENDILNILNKMKTDKSPGQDELLPRLLSEVKNEVAYPLYTVFRKKTPTHIFFHISISDV